MTDRSSRKVKLVFVEKVHIIIFWRLHLLTTPADAGRFEDGRRENTGGED
jgi:hypothetical protein